MTMRSGTYRLAKENFNPHEREARDVVCVYPGYLSLILIHTSVKLVTILLPWARAFGAF